MAIEIPQGGFTQRGAEAAITGIINRSVELEAPKDEPGTDDRKPDESVSASEPEGADQSTESSDQGAEEVEQSGGQSADKQVEVNEEPVAVEGEPESEHHEYDYAALAQALGIEENDLIIDEGQIHVRTKVNGEESTASLADLRNSFQMTSAAQKSMQEVAQERKEFQQEKKQKLDELAGQSQFFAQALQAMEQEYLNDYQNTNWHQLRSEDPDNYNLMRGDFQEREKRLNNFKEQYGKAQEQIQQQFYNQMQEVWDEGARNLNNAFNGPEYKNAPKWDTDEQGKLTQWMISQGFPKEVINTLGAWQVFKWARDSMLRQQELKTAKKTMKKIVKLPKVKTAKPSTPQTKAQKSRSNIDEAKQRQRRAAAKGQRNFNETVKVIEEMMKT